jgi:uncharacterized protein (TIGR00251 family)
MWIRSRGGDTIIACKVKPNAHKDSIEGVEGDYLKIKLASPPVEGKANEALIKLIAKRLDVAKSRISLSHGEKARIKTLMIQNMGPKEVAQALGVDPIQ